MNDDSVIHIPLFTIRDSVCSVSYSFYLQFFHLHLFLRPWGWLPHRFDFPPPPALSFVCPLHTVVPTTYESRRLQSEQRSRQKARDSCLRRDDFELQVKWPPFHLARHDSSNSREGGLSASTAVHVPRRSLDPPTEDTLRISRHSSLIRAILPSCSLPLSPHTPPLPL